ncbi:hypothetical protein [Methylovulum psychrotolerans]|uniref:Uncharacterized protein n=1 Tax=Methylovulum psychrotolerans TaxID=1704499 RepID=A0A2S5CR64_9GAMM|nr:hypothetical protein [Methylovulum psychrotolerans]POZ53295.1 hypothetical protein AADEFJLK_00314 [Methylovulum psychrotolerans]
MRRGTQVNPNWTFTDWRKESGYSIKECAKLFEVSEKTVKAWEENKRKPPRAVFLCLQIFSGRLDFLGKPWRGFRLMPDHIQADNGQHIWHYEVYALPYIYQVAELNRSRVCLAMKSRVENGEKSPPLTLPEENNVVIFRKRGDK